MQDLERAVIDVHLLARCAVVHGSGYSSYSELAHHLRTAADAFAVRFVKVDDATQGGASRVASPQSGATSLAS